MNKILLITLLLVACDNQTSEIRWFLGSWISDTELTMAENEPHLDLSPEGEEALRRALGKLRWEVAGQTLTVIGPDTETEDSFRFTVSNPTPTEFSLKSGTAVNMNIRKVGKKICADFKFDPKVKPILVAECFTLL